MNKIFSKLDSNGADLDYREPKRQRDRETKSQRDRETKRQRAREWTYLLPSTGHAASIPVAAPIIRRRRPPSASGARSRPHALARMPLKTHTISYMAFPYKGQIPDTFLA